MSSLPTIITNRLILNAPINDDINALVKILNHKIFAETMINIPFPYTIADAKFWIELSQKGIENQNQYIYAIRLKENNELIGGISLSINKKMDKAELGYWLAKKNWNNGYITEAAQAIIQFGFETLQLKRIAATHFDTNITSGKVLQKIGMTKEGILQCYTKKFGVYQNHVLYAIINNNI